MLSERLQTTLHKGNVPFNVNSLCSLGPMQFCSSGSKQHFTGKNSGNSWNVVWLTSGHALYICIYQVLHKKKKKKKLLEISAFYVYQNPQPYEVQFLRYRVRQIFFVILAFWAIFYPFTPPPPAPLTTQKTIVLKKWKKHLDMPSF